MYKTLYHPRSIKLIKKLSQKEAGKIYKKIKTLQKNPFSRSLSSKRLITTKRSWRMRVGKLRVIYELDDRTKTLYINDIDYRGSIY